MIKNPLSILQHAHHQGKYSVYSLTYALYEIALAIGTVELLYATKWGQSKVSWNRDIVRDLTKYASEWNSKRA